MDRDEKVNVPFSVLKTNKRREFLAFLGYIATI